MADSIRLWSESNLPNAERPHLKLSTTAWRAAGSYVKLHGARFWLGA
jgi:hypothetical protein